MENKLYKIHVVCINYPISMEKNEQTIKKVSDEEIEKFASGVAETIWSDTGTPHYVIKDEFDLDEFAVLAKRTLEAEQLIAHDFSSFVVNASGHRAEFEYKSGWFLEGLADGEIE
ncbi:hypothetical protein [Pedobacter sp. Leaf132]|uniref:hypothetical protein n=1 Tax=Pedobacter sp. Leaf132 TaxID=2876557 RepID=UPI001E41BF11|nr:hypothetical protein [Pedobacter sp. Leaf132]